MKKHNSTQEIMYSYLDKWRTTDLDMKSFCKKHNISYYSFKYWKYRQRDESSKNVVNSQGAWPSPEDGKFLPMQIEKQQTVSGFVINFPNGVQLNCSSNVRLDELSELIKSY
jgi:hypothetical protein